MRFRLRMWTAGVLVSFSSAGPFVSPRCTQIAKVADILSHRQNFSSSPVAGIN